MAPSDADETSAAYLASTPPAWLLDGADECLLRRLLGGFRGIA